MKSILGVDVIESINDMLTGEDAGRLAPLCVDAIEYELPECLAK